MASKYAPLFAFLMSRDMRSKQMTFKEIGAVIGFSLPRSKKYPARWSNSALNNGMRQVWSDAGFKTHTVNTASERLVFEKVSRVLSEPGKS